MGAGALTNGRGFQELDLDKRDDEAVLQFQRLLFKHWPALRDVALTNCASARKPETLREALSPLSLEELHRLAVTQLRLVAPDDADVGDAGFLRDAILAKYVASTRPKAAIAAMPLYPTETLLWDENQIPDIHYAGDACLALPKLNLQFLSFWDYLLRNFNLFRLEAAYEIREDVGDVLKARPLLVCVRAKKFVCAIESGFCGRCDVYALQVPYLKLRPAACTALDLMVTAVRRGCSGCSPLGTPATAARFSTAGAAWRRASRASRSWRWRALP